MSCCVLSVNNAAAEDSASSRISDPITMDDWKGYFGADVMSTENAGAVWTDKSVLTDSSAFGSAGIEMKDRDDFLVAMSAIASNSAVSGYSNVPIDTMMILDVSGSMNDNPGNNGSITSTSSALGFVSQLSGAYAKQQIEEKYGSDCLFYTLGLGVGDNSIATSVLNPAKSSKGINDFWTKYNSSDIGGKVVVKKASKDKPELAVTKIPQSLEQVYVDGFFEVDSKSSDAAQKLKKAFADIVVTIQLQSRYFPTLVTDTVNNSGYISFTDRIGEYMQVTDVKGILLGNTLYSGAELAKNLADKGGEAEEKLLNTVKSRLGIENTDTAKELIRLACEHGQISYTSDSQFSSYIGWYANAKGEYLGFWYDGITTMPDPSDPNLNDETRPEYIVKSYMYLGAVDEKDGVASSDMMYADARVTENIATGEQTVKFAIPAALIPTVSYNVTLDKKKECSKLTVTGAENPIRLVYGVGLKDNYALKAE